MSDRGYPVYTAEGDFVNPDLQIQTAETGGMVDTGDDIVLGHLRLLTSNPVHYQSVVVFPRKVTFGPTNQESDDYFSTIVWDNLSGGSGVYDLKETQDINRYWHSELYTRHAGAVLKPFHCTIVDVEGMATGDPRWLGDIWNATAGEYSGIYAIGAAIFMVGNPTPVVLVNVYLAPSGTGVLFRGADGVDRLVWPSSAAGAGYAYATIVAGSLTVTEVADDATHPAVMSLARFQNKIVALDWSGQLWTCADMSGAWTAETDCLLPESTRRAVLVEYFDRQGDGTIWIVTDRTAYQYVSSGPGIIGIPNLNFPRRVYSGMAAATFNDDLMIASHMGVVKYSGGVTSFVGLDRDHGLPFGMRGHIVDFVSGWQGFYAFVQYDHTEGYEGDYYCSVHEWNGVGWHEIWRGQDQTIVPGSAAITQYGDQKYRLVWGGVGSNGNHQFRYIDLPLDVSNARDLSQYDLFMPGEFDIYLGWFDLDLTGYIKLGNAFELFLENMHDDASVEVWYQVNDESNRWKSLGATKRNGITSFSLGDVAGDVARGQLFERIRFRVRVKDWTQKSPVIHHMICSALKEGYPAMSYTISLDLSKTHNGMDPRVIAAELRRIKDSGEFIPFVYMGELRRVKMTQLYGDGEGGVSAPLRSAGFSLIELPEGLSKEWYRRENRSS